MSQIRVNRVVLHWNEKTEQWRLRMRDGQFIQEFYDCGNMPLFFGDLDKSKYNFKKVITEDDE